MQADDAKSPQPQLTQEQLMAQAQSKGSSFAHGGLLVYKNLRKNRELANIVLDDWIVIKLIFYRTLVESIHFQQNNTDIEFAEGITSLIKNEPRLLLPPLPEQELKALVANIYNRKADAIWNQFSYPILSNGIDDFEKELKRANSSTSQLLPKTSSTLSDKISCHDQGRAFANGAILYLINLVRSNKVIQPKISVEAFYHAYVERFCSLLSNNREEFLNGMIETTEQKESLLVGDCLSKHAYKILIGRIKDINREYTTKIGVSRTSIEEQVTCNQRRAHEYNKSRSLYPAAGATTQQPIDETLNNKEERPLVRANSEPLIRSNPPIRQSKINGLFVNLFKNRSEDTKSMRRPMKTDGKTEKDKS